MFLVLENVDKEREAGVQIWTAERGGHIELAVEIPRDDPRVQEIIAKNVANYERVAAAKIRRCPQCGIPSESGDSCDVCVTAYNAVWGQTGLRAAHDAWKKENEERMNLLKRQKEN